MLREIANWRLYLQLYLQMEVQLYVVGILKPLYIFPYIKSKLLKQ